jgi:hypothetical protein
VSFKEAHEDMGRITIEALEHARGAKLPSVHIPRLSLPGPLASQSEIAARGRETRPGAS